MSQLWGQETRQQELREAINSYILYIQKYLDDGINEGSIKDGDTYSMAYSLFGTVCSLAVYELGNGVKEQLNSDRKNYNDMADNIINYALNGIIKHTL
jgi:hypothetical protein